MGSSSYGNHTVVSSSYGASTVAYQLLSESLLGDLFGGGGAGGGGCLFPAAVASVAELSSSHALKASASEKRSKSAAESSIMWKNFILVYC